MCSTEGCPGRTCVLLDGPTTLPHTEACRARMVGLMQQDDQGRDRLEAHERRKPEPEDPAERRAMKRASAEPEPKPAAKPKPEAPKGEKRPGGLYIRTEPQAKVKLAEKKGEKRAAAEDAEVLREETSTVQYLRPQILELVVETPGYVRTHHKMCLVCLGQRKCLNLQSRDKF